jgi:hypothetical protein
MVQVWVRIRRGGPPAVAGTVLMLLAAVGARLGLASYSFPVAVSQSLRDALWWVAIALVALAFAVVVADIVVAAAAQLRDRRASADHPVQVRPWMLLLMGLGMLLTVVGSLTSPQ